MIATWPFTLIAGLRGIGESCFMYKRHIVIAIALSLHGATACAHTTTAPAPATRQLRGLGAEEAAALLARAEDAQRRLRAGEFQPFELLAGAVASSEMTRVSPRDAFLEVRFDQVWDIEKRVTDNPLWQPYRLAYAPDGLGRLYWDIEIVLGINGDIERVLMVYKAPAPS